MPAVAGVIATIDASKLGEKAIGPFEEKARRKPLQASGSTDEYPGAQNAFMTLTRSLGSCRSTIELHPREKRFYARERVIVDAADSCFGPISRAAMRRWTLIKLAKSISNAPWHWTVSSVSWLSSACRAHIPTAISTVPGKFVGSRTRRFGVRTESTRSKPCGSPC